MQTPYSKESEQVRARKYERKGEIQQQHLEKVRKIFTKDEGFVKQGFLLFSTKGASSAKPFFFILRRNEFKQSFPVISCFKVTKETRYRLKENFPLRESHVSSQQSQLMKGNEYWFFKVTTAMYSGKSYKTVTFYFGADSEAKRTAWMEAMKDAIDNPVALQAPSRSAPSSSVPYSASAAAPSASAASSSSSSTAVPPASSSSTTPSVSASPLPPLQKLDLGEDEGELDEGVELEDVNENFNIFGEGVAEEVEYDVEVPFDDELLGEKEWYDQHNQPSTPFNSPFESPDPNPHPSPVYSATPSPVSSTTPSPSSSSSTSPVSPAPARSLFGVTSPDRGGPSPAYGPEKARVVAIMKDDDLLIKKSKALVASSDSSSFSLRLIVLRKEGRNFILSVLKNPKKNKYKIAKRFPLRNHVARAFQVADETTRLPKKAEPYFWMGLITEEYVKPEYAVPKTHLFGFTSERDRNRWISCFQACKADPTGGNEKVVLPKKEIEPEDFEPYDEDLVEVDGIGEDDGLGAGNEKLFDLFPPSNNAHLRTVSTPGVPAVSNLDGGSSLFASRSTQSPALYSASSDPSTPVYGGNSSISPYFLPPSSSSSSTPANVPRTPPPTPSSSSSSSSSSFSSFPPRDSGLQTRSTSETTISARINLDGKGEAAVSSGFGFLDHMLSALAKHSSFDLFLSVKGDTHIDDHHSIEDAALVLGQCFASAIEGNGAKAGKGIARWGYSLCPLDEALARAVVDISGRPFAKVELKLKREMIGTVSTEMLEHFVQSFAGAARITLHISVLEGANDHHKSEAAFKALAVALKMAVARGGGDNIPSTKGVLDF